MTAKERMIQIAIIQELAFSRMVERGLKDAEEGRTLSGEETSIRISSWGRRFLP